MEILTPDWLQYGALGLLGLLLVIMSVLTQIFLNRYMERQKARENHAAEVDLVEMQAVTDRMARQDEFMRQLMADDRKDRQQLAKELTNLVAKDIEAKQQMVQALQVLCQRQEAHEARLDEREEAHENRATERQAALIKAISQLRP